MFVHRLYLVEPTMSDDFRRVATAENIRAMSAGISVTIPFD